MFVALTLLFGCTEAPVYQNITGVTIHTQTAAGTSRKAIEGKKLQEAIRCLYNTENIEESQASDELLGSIYILEVKDQFGDRMFELYTNENLKGNKGRYYRNTCIYGVLEGAGR
jgi:hypothetical protein